MHEPLIGVEDFQNAQYILAGRGRARSRTRTQVRRPYYRCRYPREYALANTGEHPGNVYVAEDDVLPALDGWLAGLFEPEQIEQTVAVMVRSQPEVRSDPAAADAARVAAECDTKLARYRAALEAGTDPSLVATWTAEVQAHRAAALARVRVRTRSQQEPMSETQIRELVDALGDVRAVLGRAATDSRAAVYRQLGLRLTYAPELRTVRAAIEFSAHSWGYGLCPRTELNHSPTVTHRAELQLREVDTR